MDIRDISAALSGIEEKHLTVSGIYTRSVQHLPSGPVFMLDAGKEDMLVAPRDAGFTGTPFIAGEKNWMLCALTPENASVMRMLFPFTAPQPVLDAPISFGMGDRLGIAAPGQMRAVSRFGALPVLAQQSMRELRLTGRTYEQVLNDVSFMVFREGYSGGFGADADHLKNEDEVKYGLSCGYSMLTLDCSDYIHYEALDMDDEQIMANTKAEPLLETVYAGKSFRTDKVLISISLPELRRMNLLYGKALDFVEKIYYSYLADRPKIDLEMSVDETDCPTTAAQHYFIAAELSRRGVKLDSLAPRFCGEFQKGVDYIGDIKELEENFRVHAAIARHFGYKLSLHSGSDKFSVFSLFARCNEGRFHVKTAGTSWLEAMAVVAETEPELYRRIHVFALEAFSEAKNYYHVTTDLSKVPPLDSLKDEELIGLFSQNDARQLIHLTYGFILQAKNEQGDFLFRNELFAAWRKNAQLYEKRLDEHMTRHLRLLCETASE